MKKFINSKLGKYFLYTLLCVCIFVVIWAILGFMLYDFTYLTWEGARPAVTFQVLGSAFFCYIAIVMIED